MKKGLLKLVLVQLALIGCEVFAEEYVTGAVQETRQFYPADESAPARYTFGLDNGERYILYTDEAVVLMSEQEVKVRLSDVQDHEGQTVVCSIEYSRLVVVTTSGDKHFIEMEKPKVHGAVNGHGC